MSGRLPVSNLADIRPKLAYLLLPVMLATEAGETLGLFSFFVGWVSTQLRDSIKCPCRNEFRPTEPLSTVGWTSVQQSGLYQIPMSG